jgi:sigma-B regulation protein RsbU (phosphoserine phosphatase)
MLPIDGSSFGIFLADFTGHGVNAALNTFRLHALIHEYRLLHSDPAGLLAMLNERLVRLLPPGQFATFLHVVIDHGEGALRFASAGAPPMILAPGIAEPAALCDASGLPLGIERGTQYQLHHCEFPANSRLLLFSDGLSEFPDAGNRIGDDGLVKALDDCGPALAPHQVLDRLCETVGITENKVLPDDTTIICLDRRVDARTRPHGDHMFLDDSPALSPLPANVV